MRNYVVYYIEMVMERNDHKEEELFELGYFLHRNKDAKFLFGPCSETSDEFFVFMDRLLAKEFFSLICKIDCELKALNVTETILTGDFRNEIYDYVFSEESNKEILNAYREANLTKDMVLDLILEKGMDALSEVEINVLKRA